MADSRVGMGKYKMKLLYLLIPESEQLGKKKNEDLLKGAEPNLKEHPKSKVGTI